MLLRRFSKFENGLPDYNLQLYQPYNSFRLGMFKWMGEKYFTTGTTEYTELLQGILRGLGGELAEPMNKKMVRLMIISNSGYNGRCDEILKLSYILVALQRHLRYASTGGTNGSIL